MLCPRHNIMCQCLIITHLKKSRQQLQSEARSHNKRLVFIQNLINYFSPKRFLRNQEFFQKFSQKKWIVWADSGNHFRCSEVMSYLFIELARESIRVCYNIFVGK